VIIRVPRPSFPLFLLFALVACNDEVTGGTESSPPDAVVITPIADVQGSGDASPLSGHMVTVAGIVTGDFQNADADDTRNLGGFFLQSERPDSDPNTSDGVFVFDGDSANVDVFAGQRVQVTGEVTEWFTETQIMPATVTVIGMGSAAAVELVLPASYRLNSEGQFIADLEQYEGMLVNLPDPAFISDVFNLARYGELTLSHGDRLRQFTNGKVPDIGGFANHQKWNAGRTLILDDGLTEQNPAAYRYLNVSSSGLGANTVRIGDTVSATGNIRFSRGSGKSGIESYRLVPTSDPDIVSHNPRSETPPDTGGLINVASLNVLNFFTTIDSGQSNCGPEGDMNCRGADSDAEFTRQRAKTINTLLALDADIVGLMELENNGDSSLRNIVDGLNTEAGAGTWDYIATGHIGTDAITVGLIYRTAVTKPAGNFAVLTSSIDSRFNDQKNRPSVAQSFDVLESGGRFTVAVNHLKSKGSDCDNEWEMEAGQRIQSLPK